MGLFIGRMGGASLRECSSQSELMGVGAVCSLG